MFENEGYNLYYTTHSDKKKQRNPSVYVETEGFY